MKIENSGKISELCLTDLDKLIFTMKEAHHISEGLEQPSFMEEDWLKLALERLNAGGLTPEQRSDLSILVMQEMNERNRIKEVEKEGIKQGTETTKREDILNLIIHTDWDDEKIAMILQVPVVLVAQIRAGLPQ